MATGFCPKDLELLATEDGASGNLATTRGDTIQPLARLDNEAAHRALETLGARPVEYEVQDPVPDEFRKVVSE